MKKNHETNLFYHSPKELCSDGFLAWLFYLLDSDEAYGMFKQKFFDSFILKESDRHKEVGNISVERQLSTGKGRMDILLSFEFTSGKPSERQYVLFEDKVKSTTWEKQLSGYKDFCDGKYNMYDYIYLKLDYIDEREREIAVRNGYRVVSNEDLVASLTAIEGCHVIVDHYLEFIREGFLTDKDSIQEKIDKCLDGKVFSNASVQKYYMGQVMTTINDKGVPTSMNIGSSFGLPWVELHLPKQGAPQYGEKEEVLFWRIDRRSGEWHIRLSQYCSSGDMYWTEKKVRLQSLRSAASNILKQNHSELHPSKLSNRGKKGSDVIVLTFRDNAPQTILDNIASITKSIEEVFIKLN